MKNPITFYRYREYVAACEKAGTVPMSRTEWNTKCMKDIIDE